MYYRLTEAIKRRFILELRRYWSYHPKYPDLPDNIQGKYSFQERPQYGIVLKTSGGNRVDLSADNYIGKVNSYVYMTRVRGYNGLAMEWVREDAVAIQNNGGRFPSHPGVYYIELTEENEFYVDPLLDVRNEALTLVDATEAQLQNLALSGTLRIYEMPSQWEYQEGINYTYESDTGKITLMEPLKVGVHLVADYRYPAESMGPFPIYENRAHTQVIPGVVMAFGRRNKKGDRQAVVVQAMRSPACLEYGGRWDLTMDIDIIARDVYAQQEISDQTVIYLWGILRSHLSSENIEITDVSMGGEAEEIYDENGDDYFYTASLSMTVQTDWMIHVPLVAYINRASSMTLEEQKAISAMGDGALAGQQGNLKMLETLGLDAYRDPFFIGRTETYETIS